MFNLNKKQMIKGITLIQLVITIIVLLITTGISIGMLSGNNGILKRAAEGKEKIETAKNNEQKRISEYETKFVYPVIPVEKEAEQDSVVKAGNPTYANPIVPKGFKAINVGDAIWGTDEGYKNGLVIEDVVEGEQTKGSQFVWVPVENYEDFHAIEGYYKQGLDSYIDSLLEAGESSMPGQPTKHNTKGTQESIAMYKSVYKYKGFYIARYEAGIEGSLDNYSLDEKKKTNGEIKPLSKLGCGVWNYIAWGGNNEQSASDSLMGDDTDDGAVKVARSMYNSSRYGVKSSLCYGVQWDATLNFLDPNYIKGECTTSSIARNSKNKGYYGTNKTTVPKTTGYYSEKNIYDLAGNVYEFTMETGVFTGGFKSRVSRGGAFSGSAINHPASLRVVKSTDFMDNKFGFRVTLIIE